MKAKQNLPYYIIAIGIFLILKLAFTTAGINHLTFLLGPTNKIIEVLTGSHSVFIQDTGYFHQGLNIVIEKSCSGFNFWILCFVMLSFLSIKYFESVSGKMMAMSLSFIVSFTLTILVNSSRIFTALIIQTQGSSITKQPIIHEGIGVATNLTYLILIYLCFEKLLAKHISNAKPA